MSLGCHFTGKSAFQLMFVNKSSLSWTISSGPLAKVKLLSSVILHGVPLGEPLLFALTLAKEERWESYGKPWAMYMVMVWKAKVGKLWARKKQTDRGVKNLHTDLPSIHYQ